MSELRVAIFSGSYNHIIDGATITLNRLVKFMESKKIPVLVISTTVDKPALNHSGELVPVPSIPIPGRPDYRLAIGFPKSVRKKLREFRPTLVHLATPDLLGFRAMRYAQAYNTQIVASYHTHFIGYAKYYNLGMVEMLGWKYLRWFYSQCKHVYVPTCCMADELKRRGITEGIRIWARGVDTELFNPDKRDMEWRGALGYKDEHKIVTFVSRLVWEKGLQIYVDIVKKLNPSSCNIKPMVVGDGPAMKELQNMLPEAHFTGFITGNELARAYASSDVFLFPSETETFGIVTLEAMSSGIPVVVADATGSKSLVESGVTGFLAPPRNTNEFAKLVLQLANDDQLRARISKAARQKALAYPSWDTINSRLLENCREALEEPRPNQKFNRFTHP
ncbi:MAG: glycosyltransferase family 4 protein [bacterium]